MPQRGGGMHHYSHFWQNLIKCVRHAVCEGQMDGEMNKRLLIPFHSAHLSALMRLPHSGPAVPVQNSVFLGGGRRCGHWIEKVSEEASRQRGIAHDVRWEKGDLRGNNTLASVCPAFPKFARCAARGRAPDYFYFSRHSGFTRTTTSERGPRSRSNGKELEGERRNATDERRQPGTHGGDGDTNWANRCLSFEERQLI